MEFILRYKSGDDYHEIKNININLLIRESWRLLSDDIAIPTITKKEMEIISSQGGFRATPRDIRDHFIGGHNVRNAVSGACCCSLCNNYNSFRNALQSKPAPEPVEDQLNRVDDEDGIEWTID